MEPRTKLLEVTIRLTGKDTYDVEFYEPESGDFMRYSSDRPDFDRMLAAEIKSWASILRDEMDDEEEDGEDDNPYSEDKVKQYYTCPVCGAFIDPGTEEMGVSNGQGLMFLPWTCKSCQSTGRTVINEVDYNFFVRHEVIKEGNND